METAYSILAGGKGIRIGGRKAHAPLAGAPMITHVAKRLGRPLAVVGDAEAAQLVGADTLSDPAFGSVKGPLLGICASLEWAARTEATWVVIVPCDCPLLPNDIGDTLQRTIGTQPFACIETTRGIEPLIGIWRSDVAATISSILKSGSHPPLHHLIDDIGGTTARLPDDELLLNVNTKRELKLAEQILLDQR